jgi:hypothetical protein
MFATATIDIPVPETTPAGVLAVPRSAVIDTGQSTIVYVKASEGIFDMHAVKLGEAAGEMYPVISGLREEEEVVSQGAFLVDAENRLKPASSSDRMGK